MQIAPGYLGLTFTGGRLCFFMQQGMQVQGRVAFRWKKEPRNGIKLWAFEKR